jgi:hypothetical protein
VNILCAMHCIYKIPKALTLTNQKILSETTPKLALNWASVTWHRGTKWRPTDDKAEFEAVALWTTHVLKVIYAILTWNIPRIQTLSTTPCSTIYKSTSIFSPFPFSDSPPLFLPVNRNLHQKYFHLHYNQTTIAEVALGFLFTRLLKTIKFSSLH